MKRLIQFLLAVLPAYVSMLCGSSGWAAIIMLISACCACVFCADVSKNDEESAQFVGLVYIISVFVVITFYAI